MFRSIRWRLVLSYVFLVVLTLGVVGAIVLQLVEENVERQQREYLTTNAEAVALQAASLLWPYIDQPNLEELARTSSFLSGARVRILDANRRILADSALASARREGGWLLSPHLQGEPVILDPDTSFFLQFPSGDRLEIPFSLEEQARLFEQLAHETGLPLVVWEAGAWPGGYRMQVIQDPEDLRELGVAAATVPRSDVAISVPIRQENNLLGQVEIGHGDAQLRARRLGAHRPLDLDAAALPHAEVERDLHGTREVGRHVAQPDGDRVERRLRRWLRAAVLEVEPRPGEGDVVDGHGPGGRGGRGVCRWRRRSG